MSGSDSEDELWEVEKIVDHRFKDEDGNKIDVQYRVRWKGFPPGTFSKNFLFGICNILRRGHVGASGKSRRKYERSRSLQRTTQAERPSARRKKNPKRTIV